MRTPDIQHPKPTLQRRQMPVGRSRSQRLSDIVWRALGALLLIHALQTRTFAEPPIRVINREFPDRSGSSRIIDPSKRESTETFYDSSRRVTHKIVYRLDERLAPVSAIMYNAKGVIYQKSAYKTDGEDRIIQEVIYGPKDNLIGTKNYIYTIRTNGSIAVDVDTYDSNGNLIQTPRLSSSGRRTR